MKFLYDFVLLLLLLISLPKFLYARVTTGKYKHFFKKKRGDAFSQVNPSSRPLVWIHAVSVGETKAIQHFAELLKRKYPDICLLITSVTDTGHEEAKRSLPFADYHLYLPFDFSFLMNPILNRLKPKLVLLSETDYWFHFLNSAKNASAKIAILNGKLSTRSLSRYKMLLKIFPAYFSPLDAILAQSTRYKSRFLELNIQEEKIHVTGNLKLDAPLESIPSSDLEMLKMRLGITNDDLVLVAGSTHEGEETLILNCFHSLKSHFPNLKLLLVPRHPERFQKVEKLLNDLNTPYSCFSDEKPSSIILVNAMGQLKKCYQLATLALVGGSFVPGIGGHNIIEPCVYNVPVFFGPFMDNQLDLVDLVLTHHAGKQISPVELSKLLHEILKSKEKQNDLKAGCLSLLHSFEGSSQISLNILEKEFHLSSLLSLAEKPTNA